jgi:hypothetical protein
MMTDSVLIVAVVTMTEPFYGYQTCDACGVPKECQSQEEVVDNGIAFNFQELGYYGGFIDNAPAMGDKNLEWNLCHECILKMLQTFPMLAAKLPRGLHPTDDKTKPCCDWAWKHEGDAMTGRTYFADGLGGWK